jgi:hypothetical protein
VNTFTLTDDKIETLRSAIFNYRSALTYAIAREKRNRTLRQEQLDVLNALAAEIEAATRVRMSL